MMAKLFLQLLKMYRSSHLTISVLLILCMCIGCIESPDRTDEAIQSTNVSEDAVKASACLNLDIVDEINNRKNGTAQNVSETEEYAVYNHIIGLKDTNRTLVVIYANTTSEAIHTSASLSEGFNRFDLFENMPSLEQETLDDYESKNAKSYPLLNLFKGKYVIVNESEIYDVFSVNQTKNHYDGWEEYYALCPNSTGIHYFSRVGLNSNMDQALFEDGFNFPYILAGRGDLLLLEKRNGTWNLTGSMMTWIS